MVRAGLNILLVIHMKVNGNAVCLMVLEFTLMLTELSIKENGLKTNNKDKELKFGMMELSTQDHSMTDSSQDMEM